MKTTLLVAPFLPSMALAVHFRQALLDTLSTRRHAHAEPVGASRRQRPQARRARTDSASAKRRPARTRPIPFRIDPHAC